MTSKEPVNLLAIPIGDLKTAGAKTATISSIARKSEDDSTSRVVTIAGD